MRVYGMVDLLFNSGDHVTYQANAGNGRVCRAVIAQVNPITGRVDIDTGSFHFRDVDPIACKMRLDTNSEIL